MYLVLHGVHAASRSSQFGAGGKHVPASRVSGAKVLRDNPTPRARISLYRCKCIMRTALRSAHPFGNARLLSAALAIRIHARTIYTYTIARSRMCACVRQTDIRRETLSDLTVLRFVTRIILLLLKRTSLLLSMTRLDSELS